MVRKANIPPKEELKRLYQKAKLSTYAIARLYRCSPSSIQRALKKVRISIRDASQTRYLVTNINIPKQKLQKVYEEQKLTEFEAAGIFGC